MNQKLHISSNEICIKKYRKYILDSLRFAKKNDRFNFNGLQKYNQILHYWQKLIFVNQLNNKIKYEVIKQY